MKENTKNKIITVGFALILFAFFFGNIIKKDETISIAERRKLAQFPTITLKKLENGKAAEEFDKYTVDQFVFRDSFRSLKAFVSNDIFRQKDNNGLFMLDGSIYKMEYPINRKNIIKSASKIQNIVQKYLNNSDVYYSLIPDKNYYLESYDLKIDVKDVQKIMQESIPKAQYIDITEGLKLEDYYRTDLHWKQENLAQVVSILQQNMNLENTSYVQYEMQGLGDFYGAYYGQLARKVEADKINVLTSQTIKNATTYNYETNQNGKVYDMQKWQTSSDKYDIYLSGATPLIIIENPNCSEKKELLLFRDSFGSSLAPLLLENYSKITLIDLRYISSNILEQYVDFKNQDVLFLYSTLVLNQNVLK